MKTTKTQTQPTKHEMLGGCLTDMLFYVSQLHYTHWLTLKNHHHVIVGELYTNLEDELDELVESYLGASLPSMKPEEALNSLQVTNKPHTYKPLKSETEILALIEEIILRAKKGLTLIETDKDFSFMRDIIMDIISELQSAKYQITQQ